MALVDGEAAVVEGRLEELVGSVGAGGADVPAGRGRVVEVTAGPVAAWVSAGWWPPGMTAQTPTPIPAPTTIAITSPREELAIRELRR